MPAIITDRIKRQFSQQLFDENKGYLDATKWAAGDSDNYYFIGVAHSQDWQVTAATDNVVNPSNTERDRRLFRYNLQSLKKIEGFSFVVPLTDWTTNTIYPSYNDNIAGQPTPAYYVRTSDNHVYICLRQGKNASGEAVTSQYAPDHTDTSLPVEIDGYIWKFMYTISASDTNKFLTSNFMPVKFVDSAAPTSPDAPQKAVQDAAVAGQIIGYRVVPNSGVYTSAPTITIRGDGSGAEAHAILDGAGKLAAVHFGDSDGIGVSGDPGENVSIIPFLGSGYNQATVVVSQTSLSSGTNAQVYPVFAAPAGLGADARTDLRSNSIMFNIKPNGSESGKWVVDNEYRQVGLLKNPLQYGYDSAGAYYTDTTALALRKIVLNTAASINPTSGDPFSALVGNWADNVTVSGDSNAKAYIDYFDDSGTIWYHANEDTGFTPFRVGEPITFSSIGVGSTIRSLEAPDIDIFTGELLFMNNRTAVDRDPDQTEDIKVVIKL